VTRLLITFGAIYALGYAATVTACRYRPSADDRATWPYSFWISFQWPLFAWWAVQAMLGIGPYRDA
jgi:hypothetical protein